MSSTLSGVTGVAGSAVDVAEGSGVTAGSGGAPASGVTGAFGSIVEPLSSPTAARANGVSDLIYAKSASALAFTGATLPW